MTESDEESRVDSRASSKLDEYKSRSPAFFDEPLRSPNRTSTPRPSTSPIFAGNAVSGPIHLVPAKKLFESDGNVDIERSAQSNGNKYADKIADKPIINLRRDSRDFGAQPPHKIRKTAPQQSAQPESSGMSAAIAATDAGIKQLSAQLQRQEQADIYSTIKRIEKEMARIITLQNAKPGWIASSSSVLATLEQHLRHATSNHQSLQHATAKTHEVLDYVRNNRVFNGAVEEIQAELREAKDERFKIREDLDTIKRDVAFLRSADPSAHLPRLAYPPTVVPQSAPPPTDKDQRQKEMHRCIFCQRTNHVSIECRTYPSVNHRQNRAKILNCCQMCLNVYESDGSGFHTNCQSAHMHCKKCVDSGNRENARHNPVFCPLEIAAQSARRGDQRRASGNGKPNNRGPGQSHGGGNGQGSNNKKADESPIFFFHR